MALSWPFETSTTIYAHTQLLLLFLRVFCYSLFSVWVRRCLVVDLQEYSAEHNFTRTVRGSHFATNAKRRHQALCTGPDHSYWRIDWRYSALSSEMIKPVCFLRPTSRFRKAVELSITDEPYSYSTPTQDSMKSLSCAINCSQNVFATPDRKLGRVVSASAVYWAGPGFKPLLEDRLLCVHVWFSSVKQLSLYYIKLGNEHFHPQSI
jgi:hypothetical protein